MGFRIEGLGSTVRASGFGFHIPGFELRGAGGRRGPSRWPQRARDLVEDACADILAPSDGFT